jgi:CspA family cold shock protein
MAKGPVKWFSNNKGYGFIQCDEHGDVFVHYSDIQTEGFKTLNEGQMVEYEPEITEKGVLAKNVTLHLK